MQNNNKGSKLRTVRYDSSLSPLYWFDSDLSSIKNLEWEPLTIINCYDIILQC